MTPIWNVEWSVNTSFNGMGANLGQFTCQLDIDFVPGEAGSNFITFDPNTPGEYTFIFAVFQSGSSVVETAINGLVTALPEPGTFLLSPVGPIGIGLLGRRRLAWA